MKCRTQPRGLTFHAYAASSPRIVDCLTQGFAARFRLREAEFAKASPGEPLLLPLGQFAALVHAVTTGILRQPLLSRDLLADETVISAFEALASVKTAREGKTVSIPAGRE